MGLIRRRFRLLVRLGAAGLALLALLVLWVWAGLPSRGEVQALARTNPGKTAVMRQREEEAAARGRRLRNLQSWVPLSRVSRSLVQAVVASEDQRFFGHEGVDWEAMQQSLEKDWKERRFARGGSTITQQLAKNLFFSTRKDPVRKVRELVVARWLETDLSKRRILELYLNVIEWGDGLYGCQAAALRDYGRPCAALDEVQAAGMAAMIPSPRRLNPLVDPRRHARAQRRVLWLMGQAGYLRAAVGGMGHEPPPEEAPPDEDAPPSPAAAVEPAHAPTEEATAAPEPEGTRPAEPAPEEPASPPHTAVPGGSPPS